jgi:cytosine/adenosine deaminase-related metal-dependent hydrolase
MIKQLILKADSVIVDRGEPAFQQGVLYTTSRVIAYSRTLRHEPEAHRVDLEGYQVEPGWINAHDHLELNHYPRTKFRDRYDNAHQWGEGVNARLNDEPYKSLRAYPLEDRLFIGGLKNLLCGATTVVHHNPPHKALFRPGFPVRVVKGYGWAHSLHFSSDEEIVRSYRATPARTPWYIHLAEGTDAVAGAEYRRLKALGCVGKNTVIVHGVGLREDDLRDALAAIRGLVVCPTTNRYLLGADPPIYRWKHEGKFCRPLAVGSDSRLTADGDWLTEYHAAGAAQIRPNVLIGVPLAGSLNRGAFGDFLVSPQGRSVTRRSDYTLIAFRGAAQIGDPDLMLKFPVESVPAMLDGVPKRINLDLARRIARCALKEPGLEIDSIPEKRRKWFIGVPT